MARRKNLGKGVSVEWNYGALRGIRYGDTAPKVRATLEDWAGRIAATCNRNVYDDGYKTSSRPGKPGPPGYQGRWRTTVITADAEAMDDNARHNTLVRALHSTRPL